MLRGGDRGVLGLGFVFKDAQGGQIVLNLLKRGQGCLPVSVHKLVIRGTRLLVDAAPLPAIENQFGGRPGQGPESAGPFEKIAYVSALKTARSGDGDGWKIRGASDADLGVSFLNAPFGGGYVRAALEQFGGQADRDWRRGVSERQRYLSEFVTGLADQNGDSVLESGALNADVLG